MKEETPNGPGHTSLTLKNNLAVLSHEDSRVNMSKSAMDTAIVNRKSPN